MSSIFFNDNSKLLLDVEIHLFIMTNKILHIKGDDVNKIMPIFSPLVFDNNFNNKYLICTGKKSQNGYFKNLFNVSIYNILISNEYNSNNYIQDYIFIDYLRNHLPISDAYNLSLNYPPNIKFNTGVELLECNQQEAQMFLTLEKNLFTQSSFIVYHDLFDDDILFENINTKCVVKKNKTQSINITIENMLYSYIIIAEELNKILHIEFNDSIVTYINIYYKNRTVHCNYIDTEKKLIIVDTIISDKKYIAFYELKNQNLTVNFDNIKIPYLDEILRNPTVFNLKVEDT